MAALCGQQDGCHRAHADLANELAEYSIRVNTIHPTTVAMDMIHNDRMMRLFLPDEPAPTLDQMALISRTTHLLLPVPRLNASDVSDVVLFLASDEGRYITGLEMKIDTGYTIKPPATRERSAAKHRPIASSQN